MVLQTEIPRDWVGATDNDVRVYVEYLRANSEGRVTVNTDRSTLYIGNVTIQRGYTTNEWDEILEIYTANGRTIDSTNINFQGISDLFAHGIALVDAKENSVATPDTSRGKVTTYEAWHGDIHDDYPSGNPENTDIVNRTVRALFQRHENTIEYGDFGLLTITDDAGKGAFQRHALSIEGKNIHLLIEDKQILHTDGKLYPMDAETFAMVQEYLDKQKKKFIGRRRAIWFLTLLGGGALVAFSVNRCNSFFADSNRKAKAVQEYAKTLPNYDDSIRLATPSDEAELQRLFRLKEQNNLKIRRFADSINQAK